MAQMNPNYTHMTSSVNKLFVKPLIKKYGYKNVVWPIVLIKNANIHSYLYEVNNNTDINSLNDNRPASKSGKKDYFINYSETPRRVIPSSKELKELLDDEYECSYDCIPDSSEFSSVDLDYVWLKDGHWKAAELTTLYKPLKNEKEAVRLVRQFHKRPSWNGKEGAHGMEKLIGAAQDLGLDYWMVVVNSKKGVSNDIKTDGNAFCFRLDYDNLNRLFEGKAPKDSYFGSFEEMVGAM